MTAAVLNQVSFRARGDTVGLNVDTWDHALNANFSQAIDANFRVRFTIAETAGGMANNVAYSLQYNLAGAGYVAIGDTAAVRSALSAQFTNAEPTTQLISSGSFVAGAGYEQTTTSNITLSSQRTEIEWCLSIDSAQVANGQTILLRVVQAGGTVLDTYTATPTITVVESGTAASPSFGALELAGIAPTVAASATVTAEKGALTVTGFGPAVTADATLETSFGALGISGSAPSPATGATTAPAASAVEVTGHAPTVSGSGALGTVEIGAIEWLAQFVPTGDVFLDTVAGNLKVTGYAPTVVTSVNFTAEPSTGAIDLSAFAPAVAAAHAADPSHGTLQIVGEAPSASADVLLEPPAGILALTGYTPTVEATGTVTVQPASGSLVLAAAAPAVEADAAAAPSAGEITVSGVAPTVVAGAGATAEPSTGKIEIVGAAPTLVASATLEPSSGTLAAQGQAPSVSATHDAAPSAGALVASGEAPTASAGATVDPAAAELRLTTFAPEVTVAEGATLLPGAGSLQVAGVPSVVAASSQIEPAAGQAVITGEAPTVSAGAGATAEPAAGTLEISGYAPSLSLGVTAEPQPGSIALTGQAPATQSSHQLEPAAGTVTVVGYAPSVTAGTGAVVSTQAGSIVIAGNPVEFAGHFAAAANDSSLVIAGFAPILGGDRFIEVSAGALEIGTFPPFVVTLPRPARRIIDVDAQNRTATAARTGIVPVGAVDRQMAVSGRRRVVRIRPPRTG